MRCLKKITAAFILLLILAIPLFFAVAVLVKQRIAQHQRNERFSKETLVTITVSASAIYWVKPDKEILYDGKLFDVKSFSVNANEISLTGFFDHKEDKLVQQIVKLALQKNKSGNPFNNQAIEFLFFPAFIIKYEVISDISWKFISQQYYQFDEMIPAAPCRLPIHPPC
ncbi:MAG: hypothetical protein JNM14_06245 [Ferruginibacter sp.]|nr:hypothetical protein [Ferruginibacter sp.]